VTDQRSRQAGSERQSSAKGAKQGKRRKKKSGRKIAVWLFFTAAIAIICAIIGYLLIVLNGQRILTENQSAFDFAETTVIYDVNGNEAARMSTVENREYVEFSKIPELLRSAFIATEDKRFYEHDGVDFFAIGRAVVKDIIARSAVEGGSTITQQLAKNMFLSHDKTFFRKASEASIAVALETELTKDEILELYLNRIYFGKGAHGIQAASEHYFGKKDLNDLKLWEIATLAGIPKAPNVYNPISNSEKSQERMSVVLMLMEQQGLATAEQVAQAKAEAAAYEPPADTAQSASTQAYPAFVDYVVNEAERVTGLTEEQLRIGGYNIYTTLNVKAQRIVEQEFEDDANFEESVDDQIVQGAMIIIDHRTGEIEAMAGGRDYQKKGTNRVLDTRQPGSAFKPVTVYGPALETGDWFPWSTLRDDEKCYGDYCPRDSNAVKHIGPISMRQSLKESRNASAVWLLNEIGVQRGLDFAKKLGFSLSAEEDRNLAIALGGLTNGVTPMQMATAYSVFANGGKSVDPHAVVRIEDKRGKEIWAYEAPRAKQLIEPETAWYLTDLMQGVVEKGGTGTSARIDRPVAGKTGTTQHGIPGFRSSANRDIWFVGYTPQWTAAVWMGYPKTDEKHVLQKGSGTAAALWGKVMKQALAGSDAGRFVPPKGVKVVQKPPTVGGFSVAWNEAEMGVSISWARQKGDGLVYQLYRKEASESEFTLQAQTADTSVLDRAVEANLTYEYYVVAYNEESAIAGDSSTRQSITVPDPLDVPDPMDDLPELPELPDDILPDNGGEQGNGQPNDGQNGQEGQNGQDGTGGNGDQGNGVGAGGNAGGGGADNGTGGQNGGSQTDGTQNPGDVGVLPGLTDDAGNDGTLPVGGVGE